MGRMFLFVYQRGYRKICYQTLPFMMMLVKRSAVLVASPLVALMIDQWCCGQYYLTTSASLRSDGLLLCPWSPCYFWCPGGSKHSRNSATSCMRLLALSSKLIIACVFIIQKLAHAIPGSLFPPSKTKRKKEAGFEASSWKVLAV